MKLAPSKSAAPAHILDAQTTAVISLDSALRVVFINSTAESVFGVSRRYAIGELFTHAVPQFIPHAERLREALRAGTGFIERELQLRKSGDQAITVDCTVTPMQLGKHVIPMLVYERENGIYHK